MLNSLNHRGSLGQYIKKEKKTNHGDMSSPSWFLLWKILIFHINPLNLLRLVTDRQGNALKGNVFSVKTFF